MVFSSLTFVFYFLPIVIFAYFISPKKLKNYILLIFSLFFYAYGEPRYVVIMIGSILINYILALFVDKYRQCERKSKIVLILTVLINIGILGYFKYTNFLMDNVNWLLGTDISIKKIALPIGISFFTFQAMSYVIDVYRENGKVQKNPFNVALYISFFPQLIAGPIVRYETIAEQIDEREINSDKFSYGIQRFILGLGKKVIIANTMALIADGIMDSNISQIGVATAWLGAIAYSLQIYFDFSAYSDMAIGLGKMFGFEFLENFNYPYISKSVTDFWRRWHISLSTWFRDYVYIPLGGNRKGKWKLIRNIFVVWFLTGLWHGASWNFVIWGLYFGVLLILEKFFLSKVLDKTPDLLKHIYALIIIIFGWVIFRAPNTGFILEYGKVMFGFASANLIDNNFAYYINLYWIELIAAILFSMPVYPKIYNAVNNIKNSKAKTIGELVSIGILFCILALSVLFMINSTYNPFIYFRF